MTTPTTSGRGNIAANGYDNSIAINGSSVYLKIAKAGQAIFFYASEDGRHWTVIRAFSLGKNTPDLRVGFSSAISCGRWLYV